MTSTRSKEERRRGAFAYRGNAYVIEKVFAPVECIKHPNRVAEQYRSSNRGRRVS